MLDTCTSATGTPGRLDVLDPGTVDSPKHVVLRAVRLPHRPGQAPHEDVVEGCRNRNAARALGLRFRPRQEQLVLLPVDLRPLEAQQLLLPAPRLQGGHHHIVEMGSTGRQKPRGFIPHEPTLTRVFGPHPQGGKPGPRERGRIAVALGNGPAPEPTEVGMETVGRGTSPDGPRPGPPARSTNGRDPWLRLLLDGLFDIVGRDQMKRLLGKRDRAAVWGWDLDGGQKRVRVQRECVGARHQVSADVAFGIPRGDVGERGLGDARVWGRAIVTDRATCGLHQLGHDPSRLQGSRPRPSMDALLPPEVQSNLPAAKRQLIWSQLVGLPGPPRGRNGRRSFRTLRE